MKKAEDNNPYVEKPRASLYNVIMRLRENAIGFRHCLVIIKIADFESKKDCEPAITDLFNNMTDDNGHCFKDMATGLCCIIGNYAIQLLQIEDDLFMRFVLQELANQVGKTPYVDNAWVLHYTEEVPDSHFNTFVVKQISAQQAIKEIKNWTQFEKVHHIYHAIL